MADAAIVKMTVGQLAGIVREIGLGITPRPGGWHVINGTRGRKMIVFPGTQELVKQIQLVDFRSPAATDWAGAKYPAHVSQVIDLNVPLDAALGSFRRACLDMMS